MNSAIAMHMEARQSDDPARVAILEQQLADLHHELVTDAHSSAFEEAGWVDEMGDGALSPLILDGIQLAIYDRFWEPGTPEDPEIAALREVVTEVWARLIPVQKIVVAAVADAHQ